LLADQKQRATALHLFLSFPSLFNAIAHSPLSPFLVFWLSK
jgi:hypothetical protein